MRWVTLVPCTGWLAAAFMVAPEPAYAAPATDAEAKEEPAAAAVEERSLLENVRPKGRLLLDVGADEREDWARRYGIGQARIGFTLKEELYKVEVEADFAETSIINDAWIELRATKELRFKVGRFKEPFGAFRLESSWEHPLPYRPLISRMAEDLGYGGRDLGATVRYKLDVFEIEGGVFQGTGFGVEAPRESGVMRVTAAPFSFVELGASLARSAVFEGGEGDAAGADMRLAFAGFTGLFEWQTASDDVRGIQESGMAAVLARRIPVSPTLWLEPAVGADQLEGRKAGYGAAFGVGIADRFVSRVGLRHGPNKNAADAIATELELQLGVQL